MRLVPIRKSQEEVLGSETASLPAGGATGGVRMVAIGGSPDEANHAIDARHNTHFLFVFSAFRFMRICQKMRNL